MNVSCRYSCRNSMIGSMTNNISGCEFNNNSKKIEYKYKKNFVKIPISAKCFKCKDENKMYKIINDDLTIDEYMCKNCDSIFYI